MTPRLLSDIRTYKWREIDSYVHSAVGYYGISALVFSIDHCLNGNKAKSEYEQEKLMDDHYVVDHEYTQDEFEELSEDEQRDILMRGVGLDRLEKRNG